MLGVLLPAVSAVWVLGFGAWAFFYILKTRDGFGTAGYAAAYLGSLELMARMSGSGLPHELAKYSISALMILGMVVEKQKRAFAYPMLLYFLLLLIPGLWMSAHNFTYEEAVDQLSFNLSGPFCLCISVLYFYNRPFTVGELTRILRFALLPIVACLGFLNLKSPALRDIEFTFSANFAASGGYGPNQVASIIGLGLLILVFAFIFRIPLYKSRIMLVGLVAFLTYRGLLTFSRGGLLAPVLVSALMLGSYYLNNWREIRKLGAAMLSVLVLTLIGWFIFEQINTATGNRLYYRFSGERPTGDHVGLDRYTSGRYDIILKDIRVFLDNPMWGVGPGMGKYSRFEQGYHEIAAAHIEQSRMLSEHGVWGIVALLILVFYPIRVYLSRKNYYERLLMIMGVSFCFFFMTHSATRLAMPMFMYGMSFMRLLDTGTTADPGKITAIPKPALHG